VDPHPPSQGGHLEGSLVDPPKHQIDDPVGVGHHREFVAFFKDQVAAGMANDPVVHGRYRLDSVSGGLGEVLQRPGDHWIGHVDIDTVPEQLKLGYRKTPFSLSSSTQDTTAAIGSPSMSKERATKAAISSTVRSPEHSSNTKAAVLLR
jgi:hypothetical protein